MVSQQRLVINSAEDIIIPARKCDSREMLKSAYCKECVDIFTLLDVQVSSPNRHFRMIEFSHH